MKVNKGMLFSLAIIAILLIVRFSYNQGQRDLVYDEKNSMHGDFIITNGYVIVRDSIEVENNTQFDLHFYMYADMSEDEGLVTEKLVPACEKDTYDKKEYFIKAKSRQSFVAYFKAKKGTKDTKFDRRPPDNIIFEVRK